MGNIVIAGFSSSDRVPGFYGENKFGVGNTSASTIPLLLLLVGAQSSTGGTATEDTQVDDVLDETTARTLYGARGELSRMCIAALRIPGVAVKAISVSDAGGAVASNFMMHITGTWTTTGTLKWRIGGIAFELTIAASDTPTIVGAGVVAQTAADQDCPFTGVNTSGRVVFTCATKGTRGNDYVNVLDASGVPSGCVVTITGPAWSGGVTWTINDYVHPTVANGFYYKATVGGAGHAVTEPTWPTTVGSTVVDNAVTWTCWGEVLTGGATHPGGGTGTDAVTTALATIVTNQYDRIAAAHVDTTNLGRWETQNDAAYGPTVGILQQIVMATNRTLAACTSLAQTTLNNYLFQMLHCLNSETHPSELAAVFAAIRTSTEQDDPAAHYDDVVLTGCAPQAFPADNPGHSVKLSATNNSVTEIYTEDGKLKVTRSITTYSLNGSVPDYSVLDTAEPSVGQFVRKDLKLLWQTFKAANPRVADNPPQGARARPEGVATPDMWNGYVTLRLRSYEAGTGFPAPIIVNVSEHLPVATYNDAANRIMSAVPLEVAKSNHQIGVSVRTLAA